MQHRASNSEMWISEHIEFFSELRMKYLKQPLWDLISETLTLLEEYDKRNIEAGKGHQVRKAKFNWIRKRVIE